MSTRPDDDDETGMPPWVKWSLVAVLAIVVVLLLLGVIVGGDHGPGRHLSAPAAETVVPRGP